MMMMSDSGEGLGEMGRSQDSLGRIVGGRGGV
jgi:hypothetical protein